MTDFKLKTPVVFMIFNRPETTKRVFEEIRKARPSKLFIIADGPREDKEGESLKCQITREIVNQIDWKCEVFKNFSDTNLGCKMRISSGLDWVFENTEEAIILEDDCLPHQSFFRYCQELLDMYRTDERIITIGGTNYLADKAGCKDSYYFSQIPYVWGWATWKRAWDLYDVHMEDWTKIRNRKFTSDKWIRESVWIPFENTHNGKIDTWDYQLIFTSLKNDKLSIVPNRNLISNFGFGKDATHTASDKSRLANIERYNMEFPLIHPNTVLPNEKLDRQTIVVGFPSRNRLKQKLYRKSPALYRLLKLLVKKSG